MSRRSTLATTTGAGGRPPEPPAPSTCSLLQDPDRTRTAVRGKNRIGERSRSAAYFMTVGSCTGETPIILYRRAGSALVSAYFDYGSRRSVPLVQIETPAGLGHGALEDAKLDSSCLPQTLSLFAPPRLNPPNGPQSGSCARRDATCPSTAPSARNIP